MPFIVRSNKDSYFPLLISLKLTDFNSNVWYFLTLKNSSFSFKWLSRSPIPVDIDDAFAIPTIEDLAKFNQAQSGLSSALSRLLVTVERYPDIKANQNFLELQSQLEGTENRINVARDRFNEAVEPYNKHIKTFPNSLLAGLFNFDDLQYFRQRIA